MDVCLNTDRMLAYFDTSGHDDQTLREVHGRGPRRSFWSGACARGIFARDEQRRRRARAALGQPAAVLRLGRGVRGAAGRRRRRSYGFDTAGPRPANAVSREMRLQPGGRPRGDPRRAATSTSCERIAPFRVIDDRGDEQGGAPELAESRANGWPRQWPGGGAVHVQILVSDGLSAEAVHHNMPDLLPVLLDGLAGRGISVGQPLLARYGRVKLAEPIAERLAAELVVHLIGERPGGDALASRSLSAYLLSADRRRGSRRAAAFSGNPDPLRVHGDLEHLCRRPAAGGGGRRDRREGRRDPAPGGGEPAGGAGECGLCAFRCRRIVRGAGRRLIDRGLIDRRPISGHLSNGD